MFSYLIMFFRFVALHCTLPALLTQGYGNSHVDEMKRNRRATKKRNRSASELAGSWWLRLSGQVCCHELIETVRPRETVSYGKRDCVSGPGRQPWRSRGE